MTDHEQPTAPAAGERGQEPQQPPTLRALRDLVNAGARSTTPWRDAPGSARPSW